MTNNEKNNEANIDPQLSCGWCDTTIGNANHHSSSVCTRCYKLLSGAGVNRTEIFAPANPAFPSTDQS